MGVDISVGDSLPEEVAKVFGLPSSDASGNIAKLMGAKPIRREGGYRGSYIEAHI